MKLFDDFYVYPWVSPQENNCNTLFIDGAVPTLVDPGHSHLFNHVLDGMARDGLSPERVKLVIFTHGHPDHIEASERFDESVLKAIGKKEYEYLQDQGKELFLMAGAQTPRKPFKILLTGGSLNLGEKRLEVILTPGHSPGSICLYWKEKKALISGDTVFYLGVGRTDLPGGDMKQLADSIAELSDLDIEYLVPGHGEIVRGKKTIDKNFRMILSEFFA